MRNKLHFPLLKLPQLIPRCYAHGALRAEEDRVVLGHPLIRSLCGAIDKDPPTIGMSCVVVAGEMLGGIE